MTITTLFILILCGAVVNIMSALFGIGGGVLMVPILRTLFPELPMQVIAACSLTIVMGSSLINLCLFRRQQIPINKKSVLLWSIGMIIGVQIGFELSFAFSDFTISAIFIATLILLALRTLACKPPARGVTQEITLKEQSYGMLSCSFGGLIAGITGIGGGSIMAPLVAQIKSVNPKQIAIYTNYMMVIGGIGNLYGYLSRAFTLEPSNLSHWQINAWQIGYVNFAIVGIVVASSLATVYFAMKLRNCISPEWTTKLLSLILLCIAIYMGVLQFMMG